MNSPTLSHDGHSLVEAMREQIRATPMPPPSRSGRTLQWALTQPWLFAASVTGLGGVAAAVLIVLALTGPPPAYAVTLNGDGTVTISLRQLTGVTGLNAKLAAMGIRVRAVPVVAGCNARVRVVYNGHPGPHQTLQASPLVGINSKGRRVELGQLASITVTTHIARGQTLVLAASRSGLQVFGQVVLGSAPACVGTTQQP